MGMRSQKLSFNMTLPSESETTRKCTRYKRGTAARHSSSYPHLPPCLGTAACDPLDGAVHVKSRALDECPDAPTLLFCLNIFQVGGFAVHEQQYSWCVMSNEFLIASIRLTTESTACNAPPAVIPFIHVPRPPKTAALPSSLPLCPAMLSCSHLSPSSPRPAIRPREAPSHRARRDESKHHSGCDALPHHFGRSPSTRRLPHTPS